MKRNIDLTENRMFSSDNWFTDMSIGVLTLGLITGEKFPWNAHIPTIHSDDELDLDHQQKSIIALGDKAMRARIKEYRQMYSDNYCDCCGIRMNLKPWDREIGICHRCNLSYKKDDDKCKWRIKEIITNANIL